MDNEINVADCCRACLRIDCSLTPTSAQDNDSVKFCDKLSACVSEIMWMREGLPSLICSQCVDRLRVAYDFRNVCLQADQTLQRYYSHIQNDNNKVDVVARPLTTPTKFEFATIATNVHDSLPLIQEESSNTEYLHLKHFLDNDEELAKSDINLVDAVEVSSRSATPDSEAHGLLGDHVHQQESLAIHGERIHATSQTHLCGQLQHDCQEDPNSLCEAKHFQFMKQGTIGAQGDVMPVCTSTQIQTIVVQTVPVQPVHITSTSLIQPKQPRQIIKKTTGIQVRPLTPNSCDPMFNESKPFTCTECGKSYRKNANLRIHMRTHTGEKPFECKYCEKRFYHSSHLREHIRRHTGEKPFACAVCSKRFTIKGELTMHMKSHTGDKPFACACCDRRCLTAADLKVHMRTHTGEKPFSCATCGKKFASTYILNSHIKTHTGERPYACSVCDKTFTQSSHLSVHMRKHTGEKVACKLCDAKFTHSSQLTVHMREHTGKQPYKCTICDKICNYASELQTHMMKHTGEKFACVTCDKKFTTAAYLQEHTRTHTGENLSICSVCERAFTRAQYLDKHMLTHTGEKPFSCFICGKKFTQSSSLKVHLRIHTGEKPYACNLCDRKFTTSSDLSAHAKKHKKYINL